jgi:hypothetical protein
MGTVASRWPMPELSSSNGRVEGAFLENQLSSDMGFFLLDQPTFKSGWSSTNQCNRHLKNTPLSGGVNACIRCICQVTEIRLR